MKSIIKSSLNVVLAFAMLLFLVSCTKSRTVESGSAWTVTEKTELGALTIKDGGTINCSDDCLLTMTVDGVETPIKAGAYKGKIVLTPAKKISKALYSGMGTSGENTDYRTGLFIDAGQVVEESSVTSALVGGAYDGKSASGMTITSHNSIFDGIMINDSEYKVSNFTMTAKGAGLNDFLGLGAGIAITGKSKLEIDNYTFNGEGPIRHGIYVGGDSPDKGLTVTVNNSFMKSDGSVGEILPGSAMSSVPWVLGLETYGHVRTQLIAGYGNVSYKNSTVLSDGWGVLSTDAVGQPAKYGDTSVTLKVEDSIVDITGTSGYGSYAIGACRNIFSNIVMGNSEYSTNKYGLTYALIVANEYAGGDFINGTNVTAKYGVMYHKNQTGVTNVDSSTFNTSGANFLIKHCYPIINVSNSELNSDAGVIVQLMTSDDPGLMGSYFLEALDTSSAVKDKNFDIYHVNKINTNIFNTEVKDAVSDAQVNFSKMDIKGNFYNSVSDVKDQDLQLAGQNLVLSFDEVNLTGVISSTTAVHKNYSFYFAREKDKDGNKIAVNADGYQIDGKWEAQKSMFGPGGGDMSGGAGGPGGTGAPGGAPVGNTGEMPGGTGGAPQGAQGDMPGGTSGPPGAGPGGAAGGGMPGGAAGGGMPGGAQGGSMPSGGMHGMGGPGGGGSSMSFTPAIDSNGNYVVVGQKKYDLYEGVIVSKNAIYLGDLINTPSPAVNNGVIVTLTNGTVWNITGTSYLTSLTLDNASIVATEGNKVRMTVNGKKTDIKTGQTYTGDIVLSLIEN